MNRFLSELYGEGAKTEARRRQNLYFESSFLTEEGYKYARKLFADDAVRYAVADIKDQKLYEAVARFATSTGRNLTDFYSSNILAIIKLTKGESISVFRNLAEIPRHGEVFLHEAYAEALNGAPIRSVEITDVLDELQATGRSKAFDIIPDGGRHSRMYSEIVFNKYGWKNRCSDLLRPQEIQPE